MPETAFMITTYYSRCITPEGGALLAIAEGQMECEGLVNILKNLNPDFKSGCVGAPPM